ncbi:MAG: minor capsid protein [Bacteroidales bacterium]|nr:minor capsid protein [Bacteroidales bacterium]
MRPPKSSFRGFHKALADLYSEPQLLTLAASDIPDFSEDVWKRLVEYIFVAKTFTPDMLSAPDLRASIDETFRILSHGVDSAIKQKVPQELVDHLKNDTFLFSGFKTFHQAREISQLLLDTETGTFKSFDKFFEEVRSIHERYNQNYLRAEYNFAVQSTQMAVRWHEFEKDGDRYLLQYRTANDGLVRPEHQALHNTTLPIGDPFWNDYTPPLGWNCRCTVVQVNRGKYPESDSAAAIRAGEEATAKPKQQIFRFNPGKTERIFPPKHPYFPKGCGDCKFRAERRLGYQPDNPQCQACGAIQKCLRDEVHRRKFVLERFDSGGVIESYPIIDTTTGDYKRIHATAQHFAKQGSHVIITPKFNSPKNCPAYDEIYATLKGTRYYGTCPDLCIDGVWYEHEGFTSDKPKNALRNMLNHGLVQSSRIIIEDPHLQDWFILNGIENRKKIGKQIDEVWVKRGSHIRLLYKQ